MSNDAHTPDAARLNAFLCQHVPLYRAMEAHIIHCDAEKVALSAPLAPNINDKGIAFGGSLSAMAALAGWTLTRSTLMRHGETAEIVISASTLKFLLPLRDVIVAECVMPHTETVATFIDRYRQTGKSRWEVEVHIKAEKELAMVFHGRYAIFPQIIAQDTPDSP